MRVGILENINLLLGAASISVTHTLLPSHWLPFSLFARSHKWSLSKTLITTTIAGLFHILSAVVLGILVVVLGKRFLTLDIDVISSAILLIFGILYIILYIAKRHFQHHHELSENTTIVGLILSMMFSPCGAIPVIYIAASKGGNMFIFFMSVILIIVNIITLLLTVTLSFHGIKKLQFRFLDQYEKLIIGIILLLIGISVQVLHPII